MTKNQNMKSSNSEEEQKVSEYRNACLKYQQHLAKEKEKVADNPKKLAEVKIKQEALNELLATISGSGKAEIKVSKFNEKLDEVKPVLMRKHDGALETFVKAIGVGAASIIGVGVGGYYAHKHLFGDKATQGGKLVHDVRHANQEVKKQRR